jgi:nucleoid DNA-binding protein
MRHCYQENACMAKKKTVKKTSKKKTSAGSGKFSILDEVLAGVMESAEVTRKGEVKLKRADVKEALESAFEKAAVLAASGERVRMPFIGVLGFREIKARKAGKGKNPFTGEEIQIKARPASRKPRVTFSKASKEVFGAKKNW